MHGHSIANIFVACALLISSCGAERATHARTGFAAPLLRARPRLQQRRSNVPGGQSAVVRMAVADPSVTPLIDIKGLCASITEGEGDDGKVTNILKGVNLTVRPGEVHAIMGPNGSGKSTLSKVVARHPSYDVNGGEATFKSQNLLDLKPEEAAREGVFLAFQYPVELPGVANSDFLNMMVNAKRKHNGQDELSPLEFLALAATKCEMIGMSQDFLARNVNEGFSGGEKKRNEILQMALLEPDLAILDETDSGLDIDALRQIADGVNALRTENNGVVMITHYQRLLDYIKPDFVHVMAKGKIVKTGGPELALELEDRGYDHLV